MPTDIICSANNKKAQLQKAKKSPIQILHQMFPILPAKVTLVQATAYLLHIWYSPHSQNLSLNLYF